MKQFLKVSWIVLCILFSLLFVIAACSQVIPPSVFSYIVFLSIAFPYLFIVMAVLVLISFFVQKKLGYCLLIVLALGLYNLFQIIAVSPGSSWTQAKDKDALRIMTWNVADFINTYPLSSPKASVRKQMLQMIQAYNPDIMCLQEYTDVQRSRDLVSVRRELDSIGYKYIYQNNEVITKTFYGDILSGTAICSKRPLTDTTHVKIRFDWRAESMLYADILLQNKPIRIATAHLYSFYLFPDSAQGYSGERTVFKKIYHYKTDIEQKMRNIETTHEAQATIIRNVLDTSPHPVIYCGDMNAVATSYTYRKLKDGRQDAFLKKGNGIGATFYHILPTLRIDICFADKTLEVLQCQVAEKKLSDHYAVVTDVRWKQ